MTCSLTDLDQSCDIVTRQPERRIGPITLRAAIRCIVLHRPLAEQIEIELEDGTRLEEAAIEALYDLTSTIVLSKEFAGTP